MVVQKALYIILSDPNGNRNVLYLYRNDDGSWDWNANWLGNDWDVEHLTALLQVISFLSYLGEFCFAICPCQPPAILPTSSILRDKAIYFLLSKDWVSQSIISSILRVSIFRIANWTYVNLFLPERKLAVARVSIVLMKILSTLFPKEYLWVLGKIW